MPNARDFDIVIAGGSFVGLAQALALVRADPSLTVAVVDRTSPAEAAKAEFDGRSSALAAASRQLLTRLGVWPALGDSVQPIVDIEITDTSLDDAVRPRLLHFDGDVHPGEPAAHMVENYRLRQALIETVSAEEAVRFLAPESVDRFSASETGVDLALASGKRLRAGCLVAADGRRSATRRAAGIRCTGWRYPQVGIVATVGHDAPHNGLAVQHFLPSGPFAILPLTGNRSSIVWTERVSRGRQIAGLEDAAFLVELERRFSGRYGKLRLAGPRGVFPLELHIARAFTAQRLALVGDAAHAVHPLAGQGLNIGLRDVAALTEATVEARRLGLDTGAPEPLERYERWRRFDSAFSGLSMDALNRLFSNDSAPLRSLRSLGLGLVDRAPRLKRLFVQEAAGLAGEVPALLRGELP